MKKFFKIMLLGLGAFVLCASSCGTNPPSEQIVGGWTTAKNPEITPELAQIFDDATTGEKGEITFEPVSLVATQVVAGINYKFLCHAFGASGEELTQSYYVVVYKDLKGNCRILSTDEVI